MKSLQLNLDLTSVIVIIAVGVLLPVMLSTAAGIVAVVLAKDAGGIVTGVLVISFTATAMGSALITVVLTGRKLRLARRQADFVANVSHEFRTPLSAIRLYAQTLQSGKLADDPEQTAQCLVTILRETEWLNVMIDRVLMWRASSRDMLPLEMETLPLCQAVGDAVERFCAMVPTDEMKLTYTVDSQRPVRHDRRAMNAVILNLLTNAYKYTGKQKNIAVQVTDQNDDVLVEVIDNGIGLTSQQMKRIFLPFYRAQQRSGDGAGGVGLGLPIARYLVARHDGTIDVHSEEGEGATFSVRLPVASETA